MKRQVSREIYNLNLTNEFDKSLKLNLFENATTIGSFEEFQVILPRCVTKTRQQMLTEEQITTLDFLLYFEDRHEVYDLYKKTFENGRNVTFSKLDASNAFSKSLKLKLFRNNKNIKTIEQFEKELTLEVSKIKENYNPCPDQIHALDVLSHFHDRNLLFNIYKDLSECVIDTYSAMDVDGAQFNTLKGKTFNNIHLLSDHLNVRLREYDVLDNNLKFNMDQFHLCNQVEVVAGDVTLDEGRVIISYLKGKSTITVTGVMFLNEEFHGYHDTLICPHCENVLGCSDCPDLFYEDMENTPLENHQYKLLGDVQDAGFNIVDCGHCGHTFIHEM